MLIRPEVFRRLCRARQALTERWEGASGSRGMSMSFYDVNRRLWRMVWYGDDNRSNDFESSYGGRRLRWSA